KVLVNVSAGRNLASQVRLGGIQMTDADPAVVARTLRPVDTSRIFDESVVVSAPALPAPALPSIARSAAAPSNDISKQVESIAKPAPVQSSDASKRIEMILNSEQDEIELLLDSLLSPSTTFDSLPMLVDDSIKRRVDRIASLNDSRENSSTQMF